MSMSCTGVGPWPVESFLYQHPTESVWRQPTIESEYESFSSYLDSPADGNLLTQLQSSFQFENISNSSSDSKSSVETDPSVIFSESELLQVPGTLNGNFSTTLTSLNSIDITAGSMAATTFADLSPSNTTTMFSQDSWPSPESWSSGQATDTPFSDTELGIESPEELEVSDFENDDEASFESPDFQQSSHLLPAVETAFSRPSSLGSIMHRSPSSSSIASQNSHSSEVKTIRQREKKQPILYLFLLHTLEHPEHYQDLIHWIDRSRGVFEFSSKNKEKLANAWGKVKNNRCKMTYQKMSRALRIYIKKGIVMTKMKRKLQYIFRPNIMEELRQRKSSGKIVSHSIAEVMYNESRDHRSTS